SIKYVFQLIFRCLLAAVTAGPLVSPSNVRVLKYDNYNDGVGGFKYEVEQSDGSKSQAQGNLVIVVTEGKEVDILVVQGSYSFVIDGLTYTVRYVADQNGYHPKVVVEKPPPTPTLFTLPTPPPNTRRPPLPLRPTKSRPELHTYNHACIP
ncbi:endocuticle structural glycoprotein SgAbd-5-like, partial [Leguminivora glycinivorella]|uniref:endocuticle structural glycoprotein SgAbd-5-like n=1 Tax=Leguminivora glycinivorella TaxID=1035111 RepID=UPI00200DCD20